MMDEKAAERIDAIIVSAFSIFAALLLNLQVLIIQSRRRLSLSPSQAGEQRTWLENKDTQQRAFLAEVFANVSYR